MSDDLDEIRARKRERLRERADETTESDDGAPGEPLPVESEEQFDDVVAGHDVVLVDFYADWCGPCRMLSPVVERLAADTDAAVAKVDVDARQPLADRYGVRSLPTLLLFVDGDVAERVVGARDESALRQLVEQYT